MQKDGGAGAQDRGIWSIGGDNVSDSAFGDELSPIAQLVICSPPIAQLVESLFWV